MADAQDAANLDAEGLSHISHSNGEDAIVLRLSARFKDPSRGFTFGRSPLRCDIAFNNLKTKRLSNVHFRIYFNEYGVLMLEDLSMNGLFVDGSHLKQRDPTKATRRTINTGSVIRILMEKHEDDLEFLVRIPRREGDHERAFRANLQRHLDEVKQFRAEIEDAAKTITPDSAGHVRQPHIIHTFQAADLHQGGFIPRN
jgi:predicted component of type VI protein secretion system